MSTVATTLSELPDSRVKVDAEVAPAALAKAMNTTATALGRNLRAPGFRQGKVPAPVVIRQYGREAVLEETLRSEIGTWLGEAIEANKLHTVGDPDLSIGEIPAAGEPLKFSFEIAIRPDATLKDVAGIKVGRREPIVDDERIDKELETLRSRQGKLEAVDRKAKNGDTILMSYVGSIDGEEFEGGTGQNQTIELGSGRMIPGFEDQLVDASAGDDVEVKVTFPDDYNAEHLAGKDAVFAVTVHEVQEQVLPELDDTFAEEVAGADSLADLREEISARMKDQDEQAVEREFNEAVLDSLAERAEVEIPDVVAEARASELLEQTLHQLQHQGINREMYFQIVGKTPEEVAKDAAPEAKRELLRDAALRAYTESLDIQPAEGDLLDALAAPAAQQGMTPEKLLKRLDKDGHRDELTADVARSQAIEKLIESVTIVSVEEARKEGLYWTPEPGVEGDNGGRDWLTPVDHDHDHDH